jgi:hypothetical protein
MSAPQQDIPPAGEEIHLPGGSLQPLLLTIGITVTLLGLTTEWWVIAAGAILSVAVIVAWIQDTRREIDELPADLGH